MNYERYIDAWDDIWIRIDLETVQRERDGNFGGWFCGKGLAALHDNK